MRHMDDIKKMGRCQKSISCSDVNSFLENNVVLVSLEKSRSHLHWIIFIVFFDDKLRLTVPKYTIKDMDLDKLPLHQIYSSELPPRSGWRYPHMFKEDAKGAARVWYAGFDGRNISTVHGQVGGRLQESEPYEIETNSSGRTLVEQAVLELKQRYEIKHRKEGYRFAGEAPPDSGNAMAAHEWDRKKDILYFPVAVQPKLDGIRCMIKRNRHGVIEYRSRGNKMYDFDDIFGEEVNILLDSFPFDVELDGELYIHGVSLQAIASIANRRKSGHVNRDRLEYYVFGVRTPMDMPVEDRLEILTRAFEDAGAEPVEFDTAFDEAVAVCNDFGKIKQVRTQIANSIADIDAITSEFIEYEYEGAMIYKMGQNLPAAKKKESYYKGGRSKNILKNKPFYTEEGTIVGVSEGKGVSKGMAMIHIEDQFGIEAVMTPAEDHATRKLWFKNPKLVLGKLATFKHYGRTKDGKVRHANMIAIRDYE